MRKALTALVAAAALLTACQQESSPVANKDPVVNKDRANMDIANLPTLRQTQTQMLDLIDRIQVAVSTTVPDTRPWRWNRAWDSSGCVGGAVDGAAALFFPNLVSERALAEPEWSAVFPAVKDLAAGAGLTEVAMPQDGAGNHDARFTSGDGRELVFGTRVTTLISARVSCRRTAGESLYVDGRIPMPPDPQP